MQRNPKSPSAPPHGQYKKALAALGIASTIMAVTIFLFSSSVTTTLDKQRRTALRQHTEIAMGAIAPALTKVRQGELRPEQATEIITNQLRRMTFQDELGSNYFFILDYSGRYLLQPFDPLTEMTRGEEMMDGKGVDVAETVLSAVRNKPSGTFVEYEYVHPNMSTPCRKLSYALAIPELSVIMGTGSYTGGSPEFTGSNYLMAGGFLVLLAIAFPFAFCMRKTTNVIRTLSETLQDLQAKSEELSESEHKYRTILDNSQEGILVIQNFCIVSANNAFVGLTGYPLQELAGCHVNFLIHPDDYPAMEERHKRRLRGEVVPTKNTFRILTKQREIRWLTCMTSSIIWQNTAAQLVILTDNTELKATQHALQAEKERLHCFMDNSPFAMAVFGKDGFLRHMNKRCITMWELDAQQMIGSYNILEDPQLQKEPVRSQIRAAFRGEAVQSTPVAYNSTPHSATGVAYTVSLHLFPALHADGQVSDVILMHPYHPPVR